MSETRALLPQTLANISFRRAGDYKNIYSDLFKAIIGNGQLTIIFSRATHEPSATAETNIIEEQLEIVMSWPQMKMLAMHLISLVQAVEKEVGSIPIPNVFQNFIRENPQAQENIVRGLGLSTVPIATG
jgi:hypothetical protein